MARPNCSRSDVYCPVMRIILSHTPSAIAASAVRVPAGHPHTLALGAMFGALSVAKA